MNNLEIEMIDMQKTICNRYGATYFPSSFNQLIGIAKKSFDGLIMPINGLRHPVEIEHSSSWFIWARDYKEEDDFFEPIHIYHLLELCPKVIRYLGLPPGWRFLFDNVYEDVWFDETLLKM